MRRLGISLCAATSLLVGGMVVGSPVFGSSGQPETVPSTEPGVDTTEVAVASSAPPAGTDAPATTEAPTVSEAPTTIEAPSATTEGPVESTEAPVTSSEPAASTEGHPIVGAWLFAFVDDPGSPPFPAAFTADGIYLQADGIGAWEATGPTSALMTFVESSDEDDEFGATSTIRATIEVDPDGQSLTAQFSIEVSGEGFPEGEFGPGTVTGTRIVAEAMGTPVGSLDDLFGSFEGTEPASEDTVIASEDTAIVVETTPMAPPTTTTS